MGEDPGAAPTERASAYGAIGGEWPTDQPSSAGQELDDHLGRRRSTPEEFLTGTALGHVSAVVEDLESGTTYHFRLVAANDAGEAESADATLATPDG
jgi:hypothetical protein